MNAVHLPATQAEQMRVRRSRFQSEQTRRHYFAEQSPLMSHVLTALSMTFPAGEQFFVHSVRQVRDQITDPTLQADISTFIGQEAMHSQAHTQFNQGLDAVDYPLQQYAALMAQGLETLKTRSPRRQLAATVAYEHFTALLAAYWLRQPRFAQGFDANLQQLWLWHAVEELEHKSVAFNVYQQLFGMTADGLAQRRRSMRTVSLGFTLGVVGMTTRLLWHDRKSSLHPRQWGSNLRDVGTLLALVVRTLPAYLSFYRADFHPDQTDHHRLIASWQARLGLQA
ncbi:MAG: metal-dependent hydrolase [Moraxellaceae bacterium]